MAPAGSLASQHGRQIVKRHRLACSYDDNIHMQICAAAVYAQNSATMLSPAVPLLWMPRQRLQL